MKSQKSNTDHTHYTDLTLYLRLLSITHIEMNSFTHQQEKWSAENPACFEVKQHFATPGRAVADHINNVLTELVDS